MFKSESKKYEMIVFYVVVVICCSKVLSHSYLHIFKP